MSRESGWYGFISSEPTKKETTKNYLDRKLNEAAEQASILIELKELLEDAKVRRYIDLVQKVKG